jgi:hypothetical protein
MRFSNRTIDAIVVPEGKEEAFFFDDDLAGFGIRVRASGSRTWCICCP